MGQRFHNAYEQSKHEAELLVRRAAGRAARHDLPAEHRRRRLAHRRDRPVRGPIRPRDPARRLAARRAAAARGRRRGAAERRADRLRRRGGALDRAEPGGRRQDGPPRRPRAALRPPRVRAHRGARGQEAALRVASDAGIPGAPAAARARAALARAAARARLPEPARDLQLPERARPPRRHRHPLPAHHAATSSGSSSSCRARSPGGARMPSARPELRRTRSTRWADAAPPARAPPPRPDARRHARRRGGRLVLPRTVPYRDAHETPPGLHGGRHLRARPRGRSVPADLLRGGVRRLQPDPHRPAGRARRRVPAA